MTKKPIYLDYNATTPIDPRVTEAMLPYFSDKFGNAASSSHAYGWEASMAVGSSRKAIADAINCDPDEIIFTSGATESNNMAIMGIGYHYMCPKNKETPHFITTEVEHKCVLGVCSHLESWDCEVTYLKPDAYGQISAQQVEDAIQKNTKLISILFANNEIGTINPIAEIGAVAKKHQIPFHSDAAQAFGKLDIDVNELNIDMLSISGHKIYGPKGVGALYVRKKDPEICLYPIQYGGMQERGLRPGTMNVSGVVGLAEAIKIALADKDSEIKRIQTFRDHIISEITNACKCVQLNGHPTERLYNNVSFSFKGLSADVFSLGLSGLAFSSGSACTSDAAEPSHVLTSIGLPKELARATIRFGLGRFTTEEDVITAIQKVIQMTEKSQEISVSC